MRDFQRVPEHMAYALRLMKQTVEWMDRNESDLADVESADKIKSSLQSFVKQHQDIIDIELVELALRQAQDMQFCDSAAIAAFERLKEKIR